MKKSVLFFALIFVAALSSCHEKKLQDVNGGINSGEQILFSEMTEDMKRLADSNIFVSVPMDQGLKLFMEDNDSVLLDVRRPDEFSEGHIPGALILTNETITEESAQKILPKKDQRIFVYCRSGRRSKEASQKLVDLGYTRIVEIGGILDYKGEIEK